MAIRRRKQDQEIIYKAQRILERWFVRESEPIRCPSDAGPLLQMKLADLDHEAFAVLFLDNRHRAIAIEIMFRGDIKSTAVYPREVARAALKHNAAAVIVAHNHPSGDPTPSLADRTLTDRLYHALSLIDIKVLDHLVIGGTSWVSVKDFESELLAAQSREKARRRSARRAA